MKFSFALLALPVLAAASVLPRGHGSSCSTGKQVCCNTAFKHYNDLDTVQRGILDVLLGGIGLDAALVCDPVSVIGIGGTSCNQQVACCDHVESNDIIGVTCSPVNVNL